VPDPKLASNPHGGFLTAEPDGRLRRWSTDGRQLGSVETRTRPLSLSVSTTAGVWAVLGADGTVVTGTTTELARWRWDNPVPVAVELTPDGHTAAMISTTGLEIRAATGPDEATEVTPQIIEGATCGAGLQTAGCSRSETEKAMSNCTPRGHGSSCTALPGRRTRSDAWPGQAVAGSSPVAVPVADSWSTSTWSWTK
jgi:hypothetical protein